MPPSTLKMGGNGIGEVLDMFTSESRALTAKQLVGRFTQGAARGVALPWADEWLRLWRAEGIVSHARIDGENE